MEFWTGYIGKKPLYLMKNASQKMTSTLKAHTSFPDSQTTSSKENLGHFQLLDLLFDVTECCQSQKGKNMLQNRLNSEPMFTERVLLT